ncbi:MAG: DNA sulfur modification protein DndD [Rhodobacter sp.]|nr:DNA sulfur modification protein DndD [Rhodobacter sp.]
MILDSVTLENFGLYAGRQEIALTPPSTDRPVVLFGGMNGGGKTTLLDALQLGLFGPHARTSNRGRLGYSEYLSRCIHGHGNQNAASVTLRFRHRIEGNEDRYTLKRSWKRVNGKCAEEFDVLKNDRLAPDLAENWPSQVDVLMPLNIAHLFLFDGEQIERYASPSESATLVGTAIQNLLGLDVVEQLDKDIRVLERRKRMELSDDISRSRIEEAQAEQQALRDRIVATKQDRAALRTHKIEKRTRDLNTVEEEFRSIGGDLYERRKDMEAALSDAEEALDARSDSLREQASGVLPLLLVSDLLKSAARRDMEDVETVKARQVHELLADRDATVLKHLKTKGVETAPLALARKFLDKDRARHRKRASRETSLDLAQEARDALTALIHGGLDEARNSTSKGLALHQDARSELNRMRSIQNSIPAKDAVLEVMQRRDELKKELAALESKDAGLAREIELLEREWEQGERGLETLLEANVKGRERHDDRIRIIRCAANVRDTLGEFQAATIKRHVSRIERLVLECYQHLLRKSSLVTRLSINPESFAVSLFGRNGEGLPAGSLSAGERQLLAIALLWGLAKSSGRPLPTAIDTPIGRLDTDHRRHFVEYYVPFASHQTLLFSTNEEIVGEYLERLSPFIGRCYFLDHDDGKGCTHVRPGYFSGEHASHAN